MIDLLTARDLHENGSLKVMWLPNRHMVADCLTNALTPNEVYFDLFSRNTFSLIPTVEQEQAEETRAQLRKDQRDRAKAKKRDVRAKALATEAKRLLERPDGSDVEDERT